LHYLPVFLTLLIVVFLAVGFLAVAFFLGALPPSHASLTSVVDSSSALYVPFLVLARLGLGASLRTGAFSNFSKVTSPSFILF